MSKVLATWYAASLARSIPTFPFQRTPACPWKAFFFSRDTLELVKRVELPGLPSSYHIVNSCQEKGKGGTVSVTIAKLREGGRDKLEDTFKDLMTQRHVEHLRGACRGVH